jgi:NAD(P)H-hydrate epimerase
MQGKTALAAGPGAFAEQGSEIRPSFTCFSNYDIRKIFDADALNIIAEDTDALYLKRGDILLTPHPGEFGRLCGADAREVLADPIGAASGFRVKVRYYPAAEMARPLSSPTGQKPRW